MAWINSGDRQPARIGKYLVRLNSGAYGKTVDYGHWDGAQWVTGPGRVPAKGTLEWWESELVEKARKAEQKRQEGQNCVQRTD